MTAGEVLEIDVIAYDLDGDDLSFAVGDLPAGARFTDHGNGTATFRWIPGHEQTGNFPVTVIVTDAGVPMASDAAVITITVGDVNRPPQLSPIGNRQVATGDVLHFPITTTDPRRRPTPHHRG